MNHNEYEHNGYQFRNLHAIINFHNHIIKMLRCGTREHKGLTGKNENK